MMNDIRLRRINNPSTTAWSPSLYTREAGLSFPRPTMVYRETEMKIDKIYREEQDNAIAFVSAGSGQLPSKRAVPLD